MFKIYILLKQNNTNIGLKICKATAFSRENTNSKVPTGEKCVRVMCTALRSATVKCWL